MNFTEIIKFAVNAARPFMLLGDKGAHTAVQAMFTIKEADIKKLSSGMSAEDIEEAVRLRTVAADAVSDLALFLASRGTMKAD